MYILLMTLIIGDSTGTAVSKDQVEFFNEKTCNKVAAFLSKSNRVENLYRQARAGLKPVYIQQFNCVPYALPKPKQADPS
tara:strand:+ start:59695 stop:59934 length:240 start_codon:yes stop_codon:yes gene_type:complete